jgi:hypothetical protein
VDDAQRRKASNEAIFREVNEAIEGVQRQFTVNEGAVAHLVCECDRIDCLERLETTIAIYETVRSDSSLFLVVPGHEDASVEDIVDTGGGYLIVRKHPGEPAQVAEDTDPRS